MKIALTGITTTRNRGVEALLVTIMQGMKRVAPEAGFVVFSRGPDHDRERLASLGAEVLGDPWTRAGGSRIRQLLGRVGPLYRRLDPAYAAAGDRLRSADLLIVTGGDIFSADYGSFDVQLMPVHTALSAGVPVAFLAHSIGPFNDPRQAETWKAAARAAALVSLRETRSLAYVKETLGVTGDQVKPGVDPAFLLEPERADELAAHYGLTEERPVVALALSKGIAGFGAGCDPVAHFEACCAAIKCVLDNLGADVLLIPHVQEAAARVDDRMLGTDLARRFGFDARIRIAGADHTAAEFKGLISRCDLLVAERLHAAIAALSTGVPPLAISYSVKTDGVFDDLFGDRATETPCRIPLQDFLDRTRTEDALRRAWDRREDTAAHLRACMPRIRSEARQAFSDLAAIARRDRS